MKKLFLVVAVFMVAIAAHTQQKEGTISYQRKTNMWKLITNEQFRANVPEFQTANYVLYFTDTASLYKVIMEDRKQPYTDQQLVAILNGKGIDVARRTVTKYREHLQIPMSQMRRMWAAL